MITNTIFIHQRLRLSYCVGPMFLLLVESTDPLFHLSALPLLLSYAEIRHSEA